MTLRGESVSSSQIRKLLTARTSEPRSPPARPALRPSLNARAAAAASAASTPSPPSTSAATTNSFPQDSVYITRTRVGEECFDSVTNVGNRPTFGSESFAIETHLLNFHPIDLDADTEVELFFLQRIRDEIKFPSVEALREQIARDVNKARRYFHLTIVAKEGPPDPR